MYILGLCIKHVILAPLPLNQLSSDRLSLTNRFKQQMGVASVKPELCA